ncbi:helix-turn-helix transcriptional regulator [Celerinatantimonas sp. YJH-8]|uniref:helix-turn-helix transcriptional regulator n=1 Tax=Celerinatantimonas sp. YJH-8 TaxID=3228714 RepID=UPI0038BE7A35
MQPSANLLGAFIRAHREQLPAPQPSNDQHRRTPGLRREELAMAAGVSTTWLTWLEQGRSQSASVTVLARLAQALQLTAAERATLFELAEKHDPYLPSQTHKPLSQALLHLPEQFSGPCYVLDRHWQALSWNPQACELFIGWLDENGDERNLLRYLFLNVSARRLIPDFTERAERIVAEFRTDFSLNSHDPSLLQLTEQLCQESAEFKQLWQCQHASFRDGGERYFDHPTLGQCGYLQTSLQLSSDPSLKLVCLSRLDDTSVTN